MFHLKKFFFHFRLEVSHLEENPAGDVEYFLIPGSQMVAGRSWSVVNRVCFRIFPELASEVLVLRDGLTTKLLKLKLWDPSCGWDLPRPCDATRQCTCISKTCKGKRLNQSWWRQACPCTLRCPHLASPQVRLWWGGCSSWGPFYGEVDQEKQGILLVVEVWWRFHSSRSLRCLTKSSLAISLWEWCFPGIPQHALHHLTPHGTKV